MNQKLSLTSRKLIEADADAKADLEEELTEELKDDLEELKDDPLIEP